MGTKRTCVPCVRLSDRRILSFSMQDLSHGSRQSAILLATILVLACSLAILVVLNMDGDHQRSQEKYRKVLVGILASAYATCLLALVAEPSFGTGITSTVAFVVALLTFDLILAATLLSWDHSTLGGLYLSSGGCFLANLGLAAAAVHHSHRLPGYLPGRFAWGIAGGICVLGLCWWILTVLTT
jgi:hypothetical protein